MIISSDIDDSACAKYEHKVFEALVENRIRCLLNGLCLAKTMVLWVRPQRDLEVWGRRAAAGRQILCLQNVDIETHNRR